MSGAGEGNGGPGDLGLPGVRDGDGELSGDAPGDGEGAGTAAIESLRRGGPKFFLLLTCGFMVLLCCLGGCVTGGTVGVARMNALDADRVALGAPEGWTTEDHSAWPWAAYATLTGPADPAAFGVWLTAQGVAYDPVAVAGCLAAEAGCELSGKALGRTLRVEYRGGAEGRAEITLK